MPASPAGRTFHPADAVDDRVQRPARGDPRVLLPQRSGGRVPRVGERGLARVEQGLVQLPERLDREEHLAPDLKDGRPARAFQPRGDGSDRPDVRRDVLAGAPVAPGGRLDQRAVGVHEVDREPVDLQLAQVRTIPAEPGGAVRPAAQVFVGEDVIQAEQPLQMLDRGEQRRDRAVHSLGRRVRRAQVRVLLLDRAQLAHLGVVVDVGDGRRVEHVIPVIRLGDIQAQVGVTPPRLSRRGLEFSVRALLPRAIPAARARPVRIVLAHCVSPLAFGSLTVPPLAFGAP
jgi:hypothetical protein